MSAAAPPARSARPMGGRFRRRGSRASHALAREAAASTLADLGASAFRADIAAMRHETQCSRIRLNNARRDENETSTGRVRCRIDFGNPEERTP